MKLTMARSQKIEKVAPGAFYSQRTRSHFFNDQEPFLKLKISEENTFFSITYRKCNKKELYLLLFAHFKLC